MQGNQKVHTCPGVNQLSNYVRRIMQKCGLSFGRRSLRDPLADSFVSYCFRMYVLFKTRIFSIVLGQAITLNSLRDLANITIHSRKSQEISIYSI